jgi:hypothetical protein
MMKKSRFGSVRQDKEGRYFEAGVAILCPTTRRTERRKTSNTGF